MKKLLQEMNYFWNQKLYVITLVVTALCGYGFFITHPSIGIDDTAVSLYLEEGLEVEMGRWVMYLLNKVFHFAEFAPFMTELVGVLFLMAGATLFCVLFKRILGERMGLLPGILFSCVMVSNPLISSVLIFYFHNGTGLAYCMTALALICYNDLLDKKGKDKWLAFLYSTLFVWVAAGCYESFVVLYVLGVLVVVFLRGMVQKDKLTFRVVVSNLAFGAAAVVGTLILRAIILALMIAVFKINAPDTVLGLRSVSEMSALFGENGFQELKMLLKRFWVVYHVNALVYLPITGYEIACWVTGVYALVNLVKKKNIWYPVLFVGMLLVPVLLAVIEAKVTFYRSCQYLPFFTAFGVLLFYFAFEKMKFYKYYKGLIAILGMVLIYNQTTELNYSFYTDYRQYELARETLTDVAYEVESRYGTNIPIVFVGEYDTPYEYIKQYYVGYDSWQYRTIAAITDTVDVHLKEKYYQPQGYCFIGELNLPMVRWGLDAFDGTNRELIRFLEMHGYSFTTVQDEQILKDARSLSDELPHWPREGSVSMQDGYVLINL